MTTLNKNKITGYAYTTIDGYDSGVETEEFVFDTESEDEDEDEEFLPTFCRCLRDLLRRCFRAFSNQKVT